MLTFGGFGPYRIDWVAERGRQWPMGSSRQPSAIPDVWTLWADATLLCRKRIAASSPGQGSSKVEGHSTCRYPLVVPGPCALLLMDWTTYTRRNSRASVGTCGLWKMTNMEHSSAGLGDRWADLPARPNGESHLGDAAIVLVVTAAFPGQPAAGLAVEPLDRRKHVVADDPGWVPLKQPGDVQAVVAHSGSLRSVSFADRFSTPDRDKSVVGQVM